MPTDQAGIDSNIIDFGAQAILHRLSLAHSRRTSGRRFCFFPDSVVIQARAETTEASRTMALRAILYGRVSTDDQADRGYSLPTQLEACRRHAERLGFTVVTEFREDCSGAMPFAERPEGKRAATMVKRREADAIIAYQVDRLSRDIVDLLAQVRDWIKSGIQVHACDVGRIESELDIVLVIKGWQGSDERRKIIERTTRGKNGKARSGKVVGAGYAPYGYVYANGAFTIMEHEARVVRLIYKWYIDGDGDMKPMGLHQIAHRLSEMRIPTPGERRNMVRSRDPGMWGLTTIRKILTNETNAGVWHYGKSIGNHGERGRRALGEQVMVKVPIIVDHKTWEAAQSRREYNMRSSRRNAKHEYLLRGLIRCGCGKVMIGSFQHGQRHYRCYHQRFRDLEGPKCNEKCVHADPLEDFVWDYVQAVMRNSEDFEAALCAAQKAEEVSLEPKREQLAILHEQIAESETEAANLANALAQVRSGAVSKALHEKIDRLDELYAAQVKRRDELQAALATRKYTEENIAAARRFRENVALGMENATFEDKRRGFEALNVTVEVKNQKGVVRCIIPAEPGVIDFPLSRYHAVRTGSPRSAFRGRSDESGRGRRNRSAGAAANHRCTA